MEEVGHGPGAERAGWAIERWTLDTGRWGGGGL